MKLDLDKYNDAIKQAAKEITGDIQAAGSAMGITHRESSPSKGASLPKIKERTRERDGAVSMIGYRVRRSLIYRHKGAGKGKGGIKGSSWLDKFNVKKTTNPKSLGKMGTGGRQEAPFINKVLESEKGVDKIATIAAEHLGDAIVNNMLVK